MPTNGNTPGTGVYSHQSGDAFLIVRADLSVIFRPQTALRQQQAPQTAQIVQDAPAASDVKVELGQVVGNQEETFFTAVRMVVLGRGDLFFHVRSEERREGK